MGKAERKDVGMTVTAVVIVIITIALLAPVIYVSRYSYPWADDFSYGVDARVVYLKTGSIIKTIIEGFMVSGRTYMSHQGTYTSCFLMALQPAVWNIKLYHLTGCIMIFSMLGAYIVFGQVVFKRLWKMSFAEALSISLLTYLISIERVIGIAEAFTWYNGSVHYTFMNAVLVLFIAVLAKYMWGYSGKRTVAVVGVAILGFITAGGNFISTLSGMTLLVTIAVALLVIEKRENKKRSFLRLLPVLIVYAVGFLLNILTPGNLERGEAEGVDITNVDYGFVIRQAFKVSVLDIADKFCWEIFAVLLAVAAIAWISFGRKNREELSFKFPLPLLVILASYLVLTGIYCPVITGTLNGYDPTYVYVRATTSMARTENIIFFTMIFLMVFDVVYCVGWLRTKSIKVGSDVIGVIALVAAVIICVISVAARIMGVPGQHYLTLTAIDNLKDGTAAYYGFQQAENTNRMMSEEDPVYVMPIAVNPNSLYPYDASDYIEGARLFYQKSSVQYESEPYKFTR